MFANVLNSLGRYLRGGDLHPCSEPKESAHIAANAYLALQIGVASVDAKGDFDKANEELNWELVWRRVRTNGQYVKILASTLRVAPSRLTLDVQIDTLQDVAVKFPGLVAECPQRTHAILTKNSALRGCIQWLSDKPDLRPLDYEVVHLYVSELLDGPMGYKSIWRYIHNTFDDMETGKVKLVKADALSNVSGRSA
ncbi:hypothetical protein CERZMDRAFT_95733 [Cercospora zeae-maydis SCOH1-5]|uniref:Uncharacterized protein n=1 Tax=Cercospora zeae-maydis SCOH1-5 TaxID=717836 RepID=A0A6A6FMM6_9PEZI|nr:hypothetical protein CERZMDRAFT_95733 [Cercospora zeae-maydis SCOH1-5]